MSLGSNIGAETAAEEIIAYIEMLESILDVQQKTPQQVCELIKAKAESIRETAKAGWY